MKKAKLTSIISTVVLIVFCVSFSLVDASDNTSYHEAIRAYAKQADIIEMFYADTDDLSVGLLNYDNNSIPALVIFYRPIDEPIDYLRMQIYTYENGKLDLKFTNDNPIRYSNETRDTFAIMTDANGIDYIKHIDKDHYYATSSGQSNAYEDTYLEKFDGKFEEYCLDTLALKQKEWDIFDMDGKQFDGVYEDYELKGKESTKTEYDAFMSKFKEKQKLVSQNLEEIIDYTNKGREIFDALKPALYLNYERIDTDPVLVNGRNLVHLRALTEAMGATVEWNGKTQGITITRDDTVVKLTLKSKQTTVNGKSDDLDVPAISINGSTFVPVRFIAESFGYEVDWSDRTKIINVYDIYIDS